jgi:deoxycytidylate deaminase
MNEGDNISFPGIQRDILKRDVFMRVAIELSRLGTCPRKAVGAVIILDGRCISWGFNGAPAGTPHCGENNTAGNYSPTPGRICIPRTYNS